MATARRTQACSRRERIAHRMCMRVGVLTAIRAALHERAVPATADIVAVVNDHLAARQHGLCVTSHLEPFIGAVIDVHVMGAAVEGTDDLLALDRKSVCR